MLSRRSSLVFVFAFGLLLLIGSPTSVVLGDQANDDGNDYNDNYNYNANDDGNNNNANNDDAAGNNNDDDAQNEYYYDNIQNNGDFSAGDDTITYWTDYAILPKRCIV